MFCLRTYRTAGVSSPGNLRRNAKTGRRPVSRSGVRRHLGRDDQRGPLSVYPPPIDHHRRFGQSLLRSSRQLSL